jgi:hypothetical protein
VSWVDVEEWSGVFTRCNGLWPKYTEKKQVSRDSFTATKFWHNVRSLGPSSLWSYSSLIYNNLCNQWLSPLTLWVQIPLRWGVLDTTLCDTLIDCHDIAEIVLKVALNTITLTLMVQWILWFRVFMRYFKKFLWLFL